MKLFVFRTRVCFPLALSCSAADQGCWWRGSRIRGRAVTLHRCYQTVWCSDTRLPVTQWKGSMMFRCECATPTSSVCRWRYCAPKRVMFWCVSCAAHVFKRFLLRDTSCTPVKLSLSCNATRARRTMNVHILFRPQWFVFVFSSCLLCAPRTRHESVALFEEFAAPNSKPSPLEMPACAILAVAPGDHSQNKGYGASCQCNGQSRGRTSPTSAASSHQ